MEIYTSLVGMYSTIPPSLKSHCFLRETLRSEVTGKKLKHVKEFCEFYSLVNDMKSHTFQFLLFPPGNHP